MTWLAVSPEARFQALVVLIGGILVILGAVGGLIWRAGLWVHRQADATRANTDALVGTDSAPGLIQTVAEMRTAVDRLSQEMQDHRRGRWRLLTHFRRVD